jgi:hypothetical protein
MKRDWDIIREVLLKIESSQAHTSISSNDFECSNELIAYHMTLMFEAGLIGRANATTLDGHVYVERMTWQGHEFLDSIRDDTIWGKTKEKAVSKGLSLTFDIVISIAKKCLEEAIF